MRHRVKIMNLYCLKYVAESTYSLASITDERLARFLIELYPVSPYLSSSTQNQQAYLKS